MSGVRKSTIRKEIFKSSLSIINVTMNTYGHLMNPVNREASNRLKIAVLGESRDILRHKKKSTQP
jgi:hypothetical protein